MRVLAGDIGGTRARFGLFAAGRGGELRLLHGRTYPSADFDGPLRALRAFLREADQSADVASIAVAGPVRNGATTMTNLPWTLTESEIAEATGAASVRLLNDFEALGYLVDRLGPDDQVELQHGSGSSTGIVGLLGAGTGLGQAFAVREPEAGLTVHPCEGGHADFAARSETEWELRAFLARRHGHASWERVLSGAGLADIYDFLVETEREQQYPTTRTAMQTDDPARVISQRALARHDPACVRALDVFVSAFGACAGDLALTVGASSGIYIAGGIAPRILPAMQGGGFIDAFRSKERMSHWLIEVPVRVITRKRSGVLGAAYAGLDLETAGSWARHAVSAAP